MFDNFEIMRLERKIEQIDREIKTLKKGIEEENLYMGEVDKSSGKLYNAKDNLNGVSEKIYERISFLKSAEYMKNDFRSTISGMAFEAAESRICTTKKSLEKEKEKHRNDMEKLKRLKKQYERELKMLKQQMMEAE